MAVIPGSRVVKNVYGSVQKIGRDAGEGGSAPSCVSSSAPMYHGRVLGS